MLRCCGMIHTGKCPSVCTCFRDPCLNHSDLKPENVLILSSFASTMMNQLFSPSSSYLLVSPPTKLVGVPSLRGRGGGKHHIPSLSQYAAPNHFHLHLPHLALI